MASSLTPPTKDELLLLDQELRKLYETASLTADGRSFRGRKSKHNTATRRWINTVGFPSLCMGKLPTDEDSDMLRLVRRAC